MLVGNYLGIRCVVEKTKALKAISVGGKVSSIWSRVCFLFFLRKKIKIKLKLGGKNVWKKINRIGQEPYN